MAVDAALVDSVREIGTPTLRFYGWNPACLSLGRNQPAAGHYDESRLAAAGIEVVRRSTGGRAVLHDRELTYAVIIPDRLFGTPRAAYLTISEALADALRALGVRAQLSMGSDRAARPSLVPCFVEPSPGEILASGTVDELKSGAGADTVITVSYDAPVPDTIKALADREGVGKVEINDGQVRVFAAEPEGLLGELVSIGADAGIGVTDASQLRPSLETVFLTLTGRDYRE